MELKDLIAAEIKIKEAITVEAIMLAIVLVVIVVVAIIILVKMKPLADFSNIRLGHFELTRGKKEAEKEAGKDKQQNEALNVILAKLEGMSGDLGMMGKRLDGMDKRQDALYEYAREAVIYGTKSMVWSDQGAPYPEVVEAGLKAIMLEQDGNISERMKTVIMGQQGGLKLFRSELAKFEKVHKNKLDERFYKVIENMTYGMK